MLKQTAKIVSYLIVSLIVGITVTLITDSIENIAVEKKIRTAIENDIKAALASFRESAPLATSSDEVAFIQRYASAVMKEKVSVRERGIGKEPDNAELHYLFTLNEPKAPLDIYLRQNFLESELSILDVPDYISGIVATIITFTFIVSYTEHRKRALALQEQFEQKHKELRTALEQHEALALLGRMSAALAHELKTPVSTISNLIQTLPSRHSDEQFIKRFVTLTGAELKRTQQLIDNLLAYGKDIVVQNEEWIAFEPFLTNVLSDNTLTISVEAPPDTKIQGDTFYLDLMFKNLFRNSREAGAKTVNIKLSVPESENTPYVNVTCEDDGVGYPADADMETLTNPFVTSRSRGGGLGLYLAKKIAAAHGGTLSLYRMDTGAGIRLSFPKRRVKTV